MQYWAEMGWIKPITPSIKKISFTKFVDIRCNRLKVPKHVLEQPYRQRNGMYWHRFGIAIVNFEHIKYNNQHIRHKLEHALNFWDVTCLLMLFYMLLKFWWTAIFIYIFMDLYRYLVTSWAHHSNFFISNFHPLTLKVTFLYSLKTSQNSNGFSSVFMGYRNKTLVPKSLNLGKAYWITKTGFTVFLSRW